MRYTRETLKYTNTMLNVVHFNTNLCSVQGVEQVYKNGVKGKVIARIDLIPALEECFTKDFIDNARNSLLCVAQGVCKEEMLSQILNIYLAEDAKFRKSINTLFNECPPNLTFGQYVSIGLANRMIAYHDKIKQAFVGRSEFYICESDGYLYFSFPDIEGYEFSLYPYEVMSYAKNWSIPK